MGDGCDEIHYGDMFSILSGSHHNTTSDCFVSRMFLHDACIYGIFMEQIKVPEVSPGICQNVLKNH